MVQYQNIYGFTLIIINKHIKRHKNKKLKSTQQKNAKTNTKLYNKPQFDQGRIT